MKKAWVYDYETIKNCYLAMYVDLRNPKEILKFEMSTFQNDFAKYIAFIEDLIETQNYIISFNGLSFDSQVASYCLQHKRSLLSSSGEYISGKVFEFVQKLIELKNEKGWTIYRINELPFNELDLAAINNYNNQQKFASLKWLQFNMDWPSIIDMDCKPEDILDQQQIMKLSRYCLNDCLSTRHLFFKNIEQVEIRDQLTEYFGIPLQNLSEPKLVKAILLDLLSKDLDIDEAELKNKQTYRSKINLGEAILPYISFKTKPLVDTLNKFKGLKLDGEKLKGSFKHTVVYRGLEYSFALGGIHGAKRGIYESTDKLMIKSFDVKSYYPNLVIRNNWSPAHLNPEIFCKRYEWFYDERLKYGKKDPLNYLYKIILNAGFGLSNDKNSFLKDSFLTMQITCNGQLLLVMLMESLCEAIPGARPIMVNTDGGEIIFPREYESLYDKICKDWEEQTNLILEYEQYDKLIIWDVNNYIAIFKEYEIDSEKAKAMFESEYPKPKIKKVGDKIFHYPIKLKGRFEIDKALHKNKSYRIKAIAIYNYFVHGVPIEKTMEGNKNIFDFCAGIRAKGEWKIKQHCVEDGDIINYNTQKTVRYFVAHKGCKLIKHLRTVLTEDLDVLNKKGEITKSYKKGDVLLKNEKVEASQVMEHVLIRYNSEKEFEEYGVNYQFYKSIIQKEINSVKPDVVQSKLEF